MSPSINNHIGSDIEMEVGTYDSVAKSFTYAGENELIPGIKKQYRRVLKIIDDNHYVEGYYENQNGKAVKKFGSYITQESKKNNSAA